MARAPAPAPAISADNLLKAHMRAVEAELLHWEQYDWTGDNHLGTMNLVEFWKVSI